MQILRHIQRGKRIEDVAKELGITHGTARNHLTSIYAKLEVKNKYEAIDKAIRLGLLDP
jgi:DNA-binding NarL/FixJ family response regulator